MESITNLTSSNKNDILDPLSIIIKMFIYSFKQVGTKISIGNNKLCIQGNTFDIKNKLQYLIRKS